MSKRHYYFIEIVSKESLLNDATQKARDGDECTFHYHGCGQTCNNLCHKIELSPLDEGQIL